MSTERRDQIVRTSTDPRRMAKPATHPNPVRQAVPGP